MVSASLEEVSGTALWTVPNPGDAPLTRIPFWLFPERLANPSNSIDEIEEDWVWPVAPNPGRMTWDGVEDAAGNRLETRGNGPIQDVVLHTPVPPGGVARLRIKWRVRVPHRFGPFGHHDGQLTADGGLWPRPAPITGRRFQPWGPPGPIRWRVRIAWAGEGEVLAVVGGNARRLNGGAAPALVAHGVSHRVPILIYTSWTLSLASKPTEMVFIHRRSRHHQGPPPAFFDLGTLDTVQPIFDALTPTLGLLRHLDPSPARIVLAEAPLRRDLAIASDGLTLISDRLFEVSPLDGILDLHRRALLRGVFGTWALAQSRADARLRAPLADAVALALVSVWEAVFERTERARTKDSGPLDSSQLLNTARLLGAVDDIVEAPQFPFQSDLFHVPDDTDSLRDRLSLFAHRGRNGRRLYEGLIDRLGPRVAPLALIRRVSATRTDWLAAFRTWEIERPERDLHALIRPPASVNYRLGSVETGEDADGAWVQVEVFREGAAAISEPVAIWIDGRPAGRWWGAGGRALLRFRRPAGAGSGEPVIILDPEGRLIESDLGRSVSPIQDNTHHDRWRFLIDGVWFAASSGADSFAGLLQARLQRDADLSHRVLLQLYQEPLRTGLTGVWQMSYGPKIRPNLLRHTFDLSVGAAWLHSSDWGHRGVGGAIGLGWTDSTLVSRHDPSSGGTWRINGGLLWAHTQNDWRLGGYIEALGTRLWEVAPGHTLAGQLRVSALVGTTADAQKFTIGGRGFVRAIPVGLQRGRVRVAGSAEWRHRLSRDLAIDLFHLAWIRAIYGVAFVDIGLIGDRVADLGNEAALFIGVGYGLRATVSVLGVTPYTFGIDLSFPLFAGPWGAPPHGLLPAITFGVGQAF